MIQTILENEQELDQIRGEILGLVQRNVLRQEEYAGLSQTVRRQLARTYCSQIDDRTKRLILLVKSTAGAAKQLCLLEAEQPQAKYEPLSGWVDYLEDGTCQME